MPPRWPTRWLKYPPSADPTLANFDPEASAEDIAYLLRHVNRYMRCQLTEADIISSWAGYRPLVSTTDPHALSGMLGLSGVFMLLTFVIFAGYGLFAAAMRHQVLSRPRVMTWLRRTFAGAFVLLGAGLAVADR